MTAILERYFGLAERGTDVRTEVTAGATTFLTMAYIAFVNPQILSDAGVPFDAAFVATCVSAAPNGKASPRCRPIRCRRCWPSTSPGHYRRAWLQSS